MNDFRPSQVQPFFPNSSFQKGEKEAWAASLVVLCATREDKWDQEFAVEDFVTLAKKPPESLASIYAHMFLMGRSSFVDMPSAFHELVDEGFLKKRAEGDTLKVSPTEKMIGFYKPYVVA